MSIYITKNFKYSEFICPCGCGKVRPINPHFIYLLQSLREKLKQPVYITKGGGLRCPSYNKSVGGYSNSAHLFGKASDIRVVGMEIVSLAKQAREIGFTRIGLYPFSNFIHVDTFKSTPSASWVRGIQGRYTYFKTLEDAILFIKEKL